MIWWRPLIVTDLKGASMPPPRTVQESNHELARRILEETRRDPKSAYAGKFVGLANGQVMVVADNWDEVAQGLQQIEPDAEKTFCFEAGVDYAAVQEIWGLS